MGSYELYKEIFQPLSYVLVFYSIRIFVRSIKKKVYLESNAIPITFGMSVL